MIDYLFDSSVFIPKGHCGSGWTNTLISLYQCANIIIVLCYYFIPYQMFRLYQQRKAELPDPKILRLLIFFPLACGLSRLTNIVIFYWPVYRFFLIFEIICAISVVWLTFRLPKGINQLIDYPSLKQQVDNNAKLNEELLLRRKAQADLEQTNQNLSNVVIKLQDILRREIWLKDKEKTINELSGILKLLGSD